MDNDDIEIEDLSCNPITAKDVSKSLSNVNTPPPGLTNVSTPPCITINENSMQIRVSIPGEFR